MHLKALTPIRYEAGEAGLAQPGTTFELPDEHAAPLVESGAAEEVHAQKAAPKQENKAESTDKTSTGVTPDKPLDKMNRDELEEYADKVGLEGPYERFDTKAKLIEAIREKAG